MEEKPKLRKGREAASFIHPPKVTNRLRAQSSVGVLASAAPADGLQLTTAQPLRGSHGGEYMRDLWDRV